MGDVGHLEVRDDTAALELQIAKVGHLVRRLIRPVANTPEPCAVSTTAKAEHTPTTILIAFLLSARRGCLRSASTVRFESMIHSAKCFGV